MEADYKKMYLTLFQAITSALKAMEQQNFGAAAEILIKGHQDAEEIYLSAEDEMSTNPPSGCHCEG